MSDQQFPGFIDDDEPKKKKPAAAPPPAAAQPKAPAKPAAPPPAAAAPAAAAPAASNYEFEESAPAPKRKPPVQVRAAGSAPAPVASEPTSDQPGTADAASEPENPDLKPGSRKDLWSCPHCGTGNKPDRSSCRKCGKTPDDEIEKQWYQKPQIVGGIVGGVVLVILLFSLIGGTDLTLQPADEKHIDSKPRIGGSSSASHDIDTRTFTARKRIAVCGRCIGVNQIPVVPGSYTVVLLLGSAARGDDAAKAKATFNGEVVEVTGASKYEVLHLLKGSSAGTQPKVGSIISVAGDLGEMEGVGAYGEHVIWLDGFHQEE